MTQLAVRVGVFAILNMTLAAIWLSQDTAPASPNRWETDSNLAVMPRGAALDVVFAGSSHGWAFTACPDSAQAIEDAFGPETLNLSKKGCGPLPALCYLERFYARDNRARALVYVIDPWAVAYRRWNEDAPFLRDEPFDAAFWVRAAANGMSVKQLAASARARFALDGDSAFDRGTWCSRELDAVQPDKAAERRAYLYPGTFDGSAMTEYAGVVEAIAELAHEHDTDVLFVVPPTLLGTLPGDDELNALLDEVEANHDATWIDLADAFNDPALFRDHDHLNARGVARLAELFLVPALRPSQ